MARVILVIGAGNWHYWNGGAIASVIDLVSHARQSSFIPPSDSGPQMELGSLKDKIKERTFGCYSAGLRRTVHEITTAAIGGRRRSSN